MAARWYGSDNIASFVSQKKGNAMTELYDRGLKVRREVLGADYVDKQIASADDFNRPMQNLVTEYCWGAIWNRPGLDRRTRSMLNLAMLSALNRHHEFKAHVKGAIKNGVTKQEITEVLLQVAIYCGVPAGVEHFRLAREAFKEAGVG
jgi:4-carboxymuconolactone decarboxylase